MSFFKFSIEDSLINLHPCTKHGLFSRKHFLLLHSLEAKQFCSYRYYPPVEEELIKAFISVIKKIPLYNRDSETCSNAETEVISSCETIVPSLTKEP